MSSFGLDCSLIFIAWQSQYESYCIRITDFFFKLFDDVVIDFC